MTKRKMFLFGLLCGALLIMTSGCVSAKASLLSGEVNFETDLKIVDEENNFDVDIVVNNQIPASSNITEENVAESEATQSPNPIEKKPSESLDGHNIKNSFNENYESFTISGHHIDYVFVVNCDEVVITGHNNFIILKDCSSIVLDGHDNKIYLLNSEIIHHGGSNNNPIIINEEEYNSQFSKANMKLD